MWARLAPWDLRTFGSEVYSSANPRSLRPKAPFFLFLAQQAHSFESSSRSTVGEGWVRGLCPGASRKRVSSEGTRGKPTRPGRDLPSGRVVGAHNLVRGVGNAGCAPTSRSCQRAARVAIVSVFWRPWSLGLKRPRGEKRGHGAS